VPIPEPRPPQPPAAPEAEGPTLALLRESERSAEGGDVEQAIAFVERAIRLDSRDVSLWLRLARLQLTAQRPAVAEQLAQRAIAMARDQRDYERQGWLLVAEAREAQGDPEGAERIRDRWQTYRG
jgi:predicted Zn-dependent protease